MVCALSRLHLSAEERVHIADQVGKHAETVAAGGLHPDIGVPLVSLLLRFGGGEHQHRDRAAHYARLLLSSEGTEEAKMGKSRECSGLLASCCCDDV